MTRAFTVREWDTLAYGNGGGQIPERMADRLAALASRSPLAGKAGGGVLEHGRRGLRARGVVGVLAAQECSLEILPKIDVEPRESVAAQNAAIRRRLVHMLAVALDMNVDLGTVSDLSWQRETLLEILIRVFCGKLAEALRKGLPRGYVPKEDDLRAMRGGLNVVRQSTRFAANPSWLACRFGELSEDTVLNRHIKAAVLHLLKSSGSLSNQQRLRELAFVYADVSEVPPAALRANDVVLDRTNRQWRDLFVLAKMFLQGRYQTTTGGTGQGIALLFEMNTLFEEYIGRLLKQALAGTDLVVSLQGGRLFCLEAETSGRKVFQTKPDILIRRGGSVAHVIDTKWKRITSVLDDPKHGVAQSDVYQMMAYAQLYHAPRLTLLYPHHPGLAGDDVLRVRYRITDNQATLETATIHLKARDEVVSDLQRLVAGEAGATKSIP